MQRTRRQIIAASGALLTTGCLETEPTPPEGGTGGQTDELTPSANDRSSTGTDECQSGIRLSTKPYEPVSDLPVDLNEAERSIVATAVSKGTADYTTYGSEPLRSDIIVRHEGAFYRTDFGLSTESIPAFTMAIYWEEGQSAPENTTVVSFDDLAASDRTAIEAAALSPETEGEGDGLPQRTLSVQKYPAPYPDDGRNSRLVGGRTWVRWRDRTVRVDVAGASESTTEQRTFYYTLEQVAEDESAFRQFVADSYVVTLDDLSSSQRSVLTEAFEDRYEECTPASSDLTAVQDRLAAAEQLPHPHDDSWYVALDGERYRLRITEWVH